MGQPVGSADVRKQLDIGATRLSELVRAGELTPVLRIGRAFVFDSDEVAELARRRAQLADWGNWRVKRPVAAQ